MKTKAAFPSGESCKIIDRAGNVTRQQKAPFHRGMTLLEYFAGQALVGLLASDTGMITAYKASEAVATEAVNVACDLIRKLEEAQE